MAVDGGLNSPSFYIHNLPFPFSVIAIYWNFFPAPQAWPTLSPMAR